MFQHDIACINSICSDNEHVFYGLYDDGLLIPDMQSKKKPRLHANMCIDTIPTQLNEILPAEPINHEPQNGDLETQFFNANSNDEFLTAYPASTVTIDGVCANSPSCILSEPPMLSLESYDQDSICYIDPFKTPYAGRRKTLCPYAPKRPRPISFYLKRDVKRTVRRKIFFEDDNDHCSGKENL